MKFIMNLTTKFHLIRVVMLSALPSSELIFSLMMASCVIIMVVLGVSVCKIPLKFYAPTHRSSNLVGVNPPMFLPLLSRHVDQFMERKNAMHLNFRH